MLKLSLKNKILVTKFLWNFRVDDEGMKQIYSWKCMVACSNQCSRLLERALNEDDVAEMGLQKTEQLN